MMFQELLRQGGVLPLFSESTMIVEAQKRSQTVIVDQIFPELIKYHPLVLIALHTGMRKTEQLSLKWQDVDFRQKVITVRDSKAGKARHVPMNQVIVDTLQCLPRMISNAYVFTELWTESRARISQRDGRNVWRRQASQISTGMTCATPLRAGL